MHLTPELYALLLEGSLTPEALTATAHRHLVEACERCGAEWELAADQPGEPPWRPFVDDDRAEQTAPLPDDDRLASLVDLDSARDLVALQRHELRKAREDLRQLLRLPRNDRIPRIRRSRTRYRSRALAELLTEESRRLVRRSPQEAESLAALVAHVLRPIAAGSPGEWCRELAVRAAAHRANAVRVAGDLGRAASLFIELRREVRQQPITDPMLSGELDSLEASLAIGQRHFDRAERLLHRAAETYSQIGDDLARCRIEIQIGGLLQTQSRLEEAITHLDAVAAAMTTDTDPYLKVSTVQTRLACLCELDRSSQAADLLATHRDLYERCTDPHVNASLGDLEGRIALGLGRPAEAAEHFLTSRDGLLALGRTYDAVLASLDLACAYLEAGETRRLARLAADLYPEFKSRGVAREALAALRLLAHASLTDRLTRDLLDGLRRRLSRQHEPSP